MARLAARQRGVVSRRQLVEIGFGERAIDRAIASARLHPLFHGTYAVGHAGVSRHGRLLAATLACGDGAVVSHGTAAEVLGLREFVPEDVDVIAAVEAGRKIPASAGAPFRRRCTEVRVYGGVPCTGPSRTIVDLAGILGEAALRGAIEAAKVEAMLVVPEIDAILAGPRRRGSRVLRLILDDWRRYPAEIRVQSPGGEAAAAVDSLGPPDPALQLQASPRWQALRARLPLARPATRRRNRRQPVARQSGRPGP